MYQLSLILCLLGALTPSKLFCQKTNSIIIQTGLIHTFFDSTPLINIKYQNTQIKPFSGLLYNSIGLSYQRQLNDNSSISVEYVLYFEEYRNVHPNLLTNVVAARDYNTFNSTYEKSVSLNDNFRLIYGGGLNFRTGRESIVVNYGYFGGYTFYESLFESRIINDFGVNVRTGITYSPREWLTVFSKFDLIGFFYLSDKKGVKRIREVYNYEDYPHRIDLSLRFGLGFNFGK